MTTLKDQLKANSIVALKAHDELTLTTLRSVISEVQKQEKSGKVAVDFDDAQVLAVLASEVKKRKATADEYSRANVLDRAARELAEADILMTYLPAQLTEAEVANIITSILAGFEAATMKDFGSIMKAVTTATKGQADGKTVSALVRAKLS